MTKDDCYELGYVIKTHGVRGELSIMLDVDFPEEYAEMDSLFLEVKNELIPYFLEDINVLANRKAIIKIEELDSIEAVQGLVGSKIYLPLDVLPELDEGQFYYHEVMGFVVVDAQLGPLGKVTYVSSLPTQDVLVMEYQTREVLIPITDEIVLRADKQALQVHVNLPEGLLDVYMND
jgi:16S rRNA processing protein RimM